jgi:large subunit ribosomal protein L17
MSVRRRRSDMRHQQRKYRIGVNRAHRASLLRGLAVQVITHSKIRTTYARSMAVRPMVEKLITLAKEDSLFHRRLAYSKLNNRTAVNKLFTEIGPKYKERNGGYLRIVKLSDGRIGDNAKMSYLALV